MKTNPTNQSGFLHPRTLIAAALTATASLLALVSFATTPTNGTLTPGSGDVTFTGGAFLIPTNSSANPARPGVCPSTNPCGDFALNIAIPQSHQETHPPDTVRIENSWNRPSGHQDLH